MTQVIQHSSPGRIDGGTLQGAVTLGLGEMDVELSQLEPSSRLDLAGVQLGNVSVFRYEGEGVHRVYRRWDHIRRDNIDCYVVQLPQSASFVTGHSAAESTLHPGSFSILSTARPFQVIGYSATGSCQPFVSTHIWISGSLLRSRVPQIEAICDSPFEIVPGASRIMLKMGEAALQDGPVLSTTHSASFGAEILEAVVRTVESASETRGPSHTPRETSLGRIFERAMSFIEANLSDPSLDTTAVAEHCRVSVRYLHAAFESTGGTVAALIRERRLQLCRQVLRNPSVRNRSIWEISTDWGFNDASHFSHAYKTRFGIAPSKERLRAQR